MTLADATDWCGVMLVMLAHASLRCGSVGAGIVWCGLLTCGCVGGSSVGTGMGMFGVWLGSAHTVDVLVIMLVAFLVMLVAVFIVLGIFIVGLVVIIWLFIFITSIPFVILCFLERVAAIVGFIGAVLQFSGPAALGSGSGHRLSKVLFSAGVGCL